MAPAVRSMFRQHLRGLCTSDAARQLCAVMLLGWLLAMQPVEAGSWGRWMRSDCYHSLEYRVRYVRPAGGERHEWLVEIRNGYREPATFRWVLADTQQPKPRLNNAMSLRAGGRLRRNSMMAAGPRAQVRLFTANLRLGGKNGVDRACDVAK